MNARSNHSHEWRSSTRLGAEFNFVVPHQMINRWGDPDDLSSIDRPLGMLPRRYRKSNHVYQLEMLRCPRIRKNHRGR